MAKRWYKKDVKLMRQALDWTWRSMQPLELPIIDTRLHEKIVERREAFRALDRARVVSTHLAALGSLHEGRSKDEAEAAKSFRETRAYGDSTEMMVARFEGLAAGSRKAAVRLRGLIDRIESEGLPEEVVSYDPTRPEE